MSVQTPEISLMGIDAAQAQLIRSACTGATGTIEVMPLDKGLSGAKVVLAQWPLANGGASAPHVLKIGPLHKLSSEAEKVETLVAPVDPQVGHVRLFPDSEKEVGLLRQAFIGSPDGRVESLREWIHEASCPREVYTQIEKLYSQRMRQWHCPENTAPPLALQSFADAFQWRVERQAELANAFADVGSEALEKSFAAQGFASLSAIETAIARLNTTSENLPQGLVHGDLHAQNVLVSDGQLQLIDFYWAHHGWKAVDFIMLECSLKFLVIPDECRIEDLVHLEIAIETGLDPLGEISDFNDRPYSRYLRTFAAALAAIRGQALHWGSVSDVEQYRRGLIVLMSCLGTYPGLNRNFLSHSLAYHVSRLI